MSQRLHKVNENLQRELSRLLSEEPIVESGLITLTHVIVSADLREATAWISILNNPEPQTVIELLNKRSVEFYEPLSNRLRMKYVPRLIFKLNEHSDEVSKIDAIIDDLHKGNV